MNLTKLILKLEGLDCSSCAVDIDLTLEDTPGIKDVRTNFAKSECLVSFDEQLISFDQIQKMIYELGYKVSSYVPQNS